jgi:hypothetical protein
MKMKFIVLGMAFFVAVLTTGCRLFKPKEVPVTNSTSQPEIRNLIIFYDAKVGKEILLEAVNQYGAKLLYDYTNLNGIAVAVPENKSMNDAIKYFKKVNGVLSVEKDQVQSIQMQ